MKTKILTLITFFPLVIFGQLNIDSLVQEGIKLHDSQQYQEAIGVYKQALKQEPKSSLVNYEIAMSYMYAKDYKKSIKHCNVVIKQDNGLLSQAFTAKGTCYDHLGNPKKAIKIYKEGLEKSDPGYLLNYNLGFTLYKNNEFIEADKYLKDAIGLKQDHGTSHLILGISNYKQGNTSKSLLALYYFLLLEANTQRSEIALNLINEQKSGSVIRDEENAKNITIEVASGELDSKFGAANLMIYMLEANRNSDENLDMTETDFFLDETKSLFTIFGELNDDDAVGFWWDLYVPFFYDLAQTNHIETFCHYIRISKSDESKQWLQDNKEKLEAFVNWLEE